MSRPRSQFLGPDTITTLVLGAASAVVVVLVAFFPSDFPFTPLTVPLFLSTLLLSRQRMVSFAVYTALCLTLAAIFQESHSARTIAAFAVQYGLCLTVVMIGLRDGLGIGRLRGESMLVDLRDRIRAQGELPSMPEGWLVESAMTSAGGAPFAGDFVVATTRECGTVLEVAVVDVSGKGEAAGTRALQLSGAMSGLLGALPSDRFLPAANEFLIKRAWEEGFATAVHLSVDVTTGEYAVRTAGHPPAAHRHAGTGRWSVVEAEGTVLGLFEGSAPEPVTGQLLPGDALLLYTDGMVEEPGRDIELGIDAMLGAAEALAVDSWDGVVTDLVAAVGSPEDDRAALLVHRRAR
ncbi:PP2C family protein-serine/threonine phosphatase [Nocardioides sambongensis]|uniref:PP2C family protein-serine/threonine phosphatase n=1 Tax=Nocardioides sambongensis TaxID=2589074 RepID=UPI00112ABFD1|nr:PP2C family protein-serine/threonine phosphatase [Nocardioides sambongensis]